MRSFLPVVMAAALFPCPALAGVPDCSPPVRVEPLPGFVLTLCESRGWDEVELLVDWEADRHETISGEHWELQYEIPGDPEKLPSPVQVTRNILGALAPLGGRTLWRSEDRALAVLDLHGRKVWVRANVLNSGAIYELTMVREQAFEQEMTATAGALAEGLQASGHAVLSGIHFDLDSDRLRPESDTALGEAAKLLAGEPELRLWVVGHTDATGSFEHNLDLSRRRARAVVRALVERFGVAAERLEAHGVGPLAPVVSNATESGRALNRRVELVAR